MTDRSQNIASRTYGQANSSTISQSPEIPTVFRPGSEWRYQYIRLFIADTRRWLSTRTKDNFRKQRQRRREVLFEERETLTLWLQRHVNDTEHGRFAEFTDSLRDVEAELAELAFFVDRVGKKLESWEPAADGSIRPEQIEWMNQYANSDDIFAEWITASRYKAIYGDWPGGIKPDHPSYIGLPVWKIVWLRSQHDPRRKQEGKRQHRARQQGRIQTSQDSDPANSDRLRDDDRISVTPLGLAVLARRNRGAV